MATKNKIVKSTPTSLALPSPTPSDHFQAGVRALAEILSNREITPIKLTETYDTIRIYSKAIAAMEDMAKDQLKAIVLATGVKEETKGLFAQIGSYRLEARPVNTKLDSKKVESMLRNKNLPIDKGMDQEISYKINESKLADLVTRKKITEDELESCRHDLKYSLQPPKKVENG